jgi:hypothetical protein
MFIHENCGEKNVLEKHRIESRVYLIGNELRKSFSLKLKFFQFECQNRNEFKFRTSENDATNFFDNINLIQLTSNRKL